LGHREDQENRGTIRTKIDREKRKKRKYLREGDRDHGKKEIRSKEKSGISNRLKVKRKMPGKFQ